MFNERLKILAEHVAELIDQELWGQVAAQISNLPPPDIAEFISHYDRDVIEALFNVLPESVKPDVLAELDPELAAEITASLSSDEISDLFEEMDPDDAADVLGELDEEISSQVIEKMDEEDAAEVRKLMTYPEDSAGGIMTTDLIHMRPDQTVLEALDAIAERGDESHIYQICIVDEHHRLIGTVTIWGLLRQHNRNIRLGDIMEREFFSVHSDTDQEKVARTITKYGLSVIPVVDSHGVLLGRITHDDVLHVVKEEAEEDIFRLAGSDDDELGNTSILRSCAIRLPWLTVTLLGGVVTSTLLNLYTKRFSSLVILAAFIPNVMAMGGNTGLQSSVLLIREIAAGPARRHAMGRLFRHEMRTGALMGIICGIGIFIWALALMKISPPGSPDAIPCSPFHLAGVVGIALFASMTFAAGFGAIVPIVLERLKIDPAAASGPFISVMNDISALLIYYGISFLLIMRVLG
ncbi:MAG: magnesium transporter [Kiritimatiellia bacterium]|jgi:magnesium transporter